MENVLYSHSLHSIRIPNINCLELNAMCMRVKSRSIYAHIHIHTFILLVLSSWKHYCFMEHLTKWNYDILLNSNRLYTTPSVGNIPILRLNTERPPVLCVFNAHLLTGHIERQPKSPDYETPGCAPSHQDPLLLPIFSWIVSYSTSNTSWI